MKQITIFGATGFIGRHLVRRLARTGAIIRIPTRDREKALLLKPMGDVGQIVPIACDVHSDASIAAAIGPSQAVINLIGILYEKSRNTFPAIHVDLAARIARMAGEQGATRYVHMSALGASPSGPSHYARSKAKGEAAVCNFFPEATMIRPSIVFGPEDHFFNLFAAMACVSPFLPLIGGGATKFQPVYVGDIAEAIVRVLDIAETAGQTFECGGPDILSFRDLLEIMLRVIQRRRILVNLPYALAHAQAGLLELMPKPLLTRDQVNSLKVDNLVTASQHNLADLGIDATGLEMILPTYLARFRPAEALHKTANVIS